MVSLAKTKKTLSTLAIMVLVAVGVNYLPRALPFFQILESWVTDIRIAAISPLLPQSEDILVVAITEDTLATLPYRSPVDRMFLANLLETLEDAGVRAIGLDILFDQPTEAAKDEALRETISGLTVPTIISSVDRDSNLTESQYRYLEDYLRGFDTGLANLAKDPFDATVRWIFPGKTVNGEWRPGFAAALARILGVSPPNHLIRLAFYGNPEDETPVFRTYPAHLVPILAKKAKKWFAGKIAIIGTDLPDSDRHRTPFAAAFGTKTGSVPGVLIHAYSLSQLLEGRELPLIGESGEMALIVLLAALGAILAAVDAPGLLKLMVFLLLLVLFWIGGFALYRFGGPLVPLVMPSLGFAATAGAASAYLSRHERRQKRFIRETFSRYLSPNIVSEILAKPSLLNLGGEKREMTYVFTDIAGFTSLTEKTDPPELVRLLNEYLDGMCQIFFRHGATLDKIIGDAVVGFFGAPLDQPDHASRAVACALDLDAFSTKFAAEAQARGHDFGLTRIGVNTGVATVGNFGGESFTDYTAFGDMVNTAARLESVNKHLGTRVCVSGETAGKCPDVDFRPVGTLVLKGKTEGIEAFTPLASAEVRSRATAAYMKAFKLLEGNHSAAREAFSRAVRMAPDDGLAAFHLRRLKAGESGTRIVMSEK